MKKFPETIVAIDIETTGLDFHSDRVIEIAAVVFQNGKISARFSELINPQRTLSARITQLTGIKQSMVDEARKQDAVIAEFLDFLPDDAVGLAHNASFDASFLHRASDGLFRLPMLDTLRLSGICFPEFSSHSLAFLKKELSLPENDAHRALEDAESALWLFQRLKTELESLPGPVLRELALLYDTFRSDPIRTLLYSLAAASRDSGEEKEFSEYFSLKPFVKPRQEANPDDFTPLPPEPITAILGSAGPFAKKLSGYELREEQLRMVNEVQEAFNQQQHLLVEAGTGTGKSFAYLLPCLLWARENDSPVVVSTNTKNLQSQLFEEDLPRLCTALGGGFRTALIKGRGNYLCLRRLLYLLQNAGLELEREERAPLASVVRWAIQTKTGDLSETIVGERPHLREFAQRLVSVSEECRGKDCPMFRRCFVQDARRKALAADVVVANHSLVLSDLTSTQTSKALPPYHQIVFDEAHNLEDAATNALAHEVSQLRANFVLNRLVRQGKKGGRGLLPNILRRLKRGIPEEEAVERAIATGEKIEKVVDRARHALPFFFRALTNVFDHHKELGTLRIRAERRLPSQWKEIFAQRDLMLTALADVLHTTEAFVEALNHVEDHALPERLNYLAEVRAAGLWLREFTEDVELVLAADNPEFVFWVERIPKKKSSRNNSGKSDAEAGSRWSRSSRAWAAPIHIGNLMNLELFSKKCSVILTSATLSVGGSMEFIEERLGINLIPPEKRRQLVLGTPFNYQEQCLVLVPGFLPEPGDKNRSYTTELSLLLADVFRETQGRGMVLFTSYEMLRNSAGEIQRRLAGDDIRVLAQSLSGSREKITRLFREDLRSVLLGTHSFWEGVDVVGESLSCLVVSRLPFAVFTEPLIEARCEDIEKNGRNAFVAFSVPNAIIRFRQGFGRLIRHRTDRGVVLITDRRIISKFYGAQFREALPTQLEVVPSLHELLMEIRDFLN